jgi:hypothetical protein
MAEAVAKSSGEVGVGNGMSAAGQAYSKFKRGEAAYKASKDPYSRHFEESDYRMGMHGSWMESVGDVLNGTHQGHDLTQEEYDDKMAEEWATSLDPPDEEDEPFDPDSPTNASESNESPVVVSD